MLRLGLTGGIGSGKSTVARMLVNQGATLIDADALSRAATAVGGSAISQIAAHFGRESIIHPYVGVEATRLAEVARQAGSALVVFDIPLLVESRRWRQLLDKVLIVDCEEMTQIGRVSARESGNAGWTPQTVEKVIAQQASRAERLAAADMVIYNEGLSLDELVTQVGEISHHITL